MAVDVGAFLDLQRLVNDIAGHARALGEHDACRFDLTGHRSGNLHVFSEDRSLDGRAGTDGHLAGPDVAFDMPIDLDVFVALQLAGHFQRRADPRGLRRRAYLGGRPMVRRAGLYRAVAGLLLRTCRRLDLLHGRCGGRLGGFVT